jgi:exodeoxyribonuclease VII large subunit
MVQRLRPLYLERNLTEHREQVTSLVARLQRSIRERLAQGRISAENVASRLDGLSPLATLSRGFSITFRADTGTVVTDASSVIAGDEVHVRLHRGRLKCDVIETEMSDQSDALSSR